MVKSIAKGAKSKPTIASLFRKKAGLATLSICVLVFTQVVQGAPSYSWSCYLPGSPSEEVFGLSLSSEMGFVHFDGNKILTAYDRRGLERIWTWTQQNSQRKYEILLAPNGEAVYSQIEQSENVSESSDQESGYLCQKSSGSQSKISQRVPNDEKEKSKSKSEVKLNWQRLNFGMTTQEVENLLGAPKSQQLLQNKLYWYYSSNNFLIFESKSRSRRPQNVGPRRTVQRAGSGSEREQELVLWQYKG